MMKKLLCLAILASSHAFGMKNDNVHFELKHTIDLKTGIGDLAFNPQNKNRLAAGLSNGKIALISLGGEKTNIDYEGDSKHWILSIDWSPDGKFLASPFKQDESKFGVSLWVDDNPKGNKGCLIKTSDPLALNNDHIINVVDVAWNAKGDCLAINCNCGNFNIVIISRDGKLKKELSATCVACHCLSWNPAEQRGNILAYANGRTVYITNVCDDRPQMIFEADSLDKKIEQVAWSLDGKKLAVMTSSHDKDYRIYVLEPTIDKTKIASKTLYEFKHHELLLAFAWGPNDLLAVSHTGGEGNVTICDTKIGKQIATIKTNLDWPSQLAWSKDGELLAVGGERGKLQIYTVAFDSGEKLKVI